MVIGRTTGSGLIPVILGDGELIPINLNSPKVVIFRQGKSTGRELEIVKALGVVLAVNDPRLRPISKPICNFTVDPENQSGPLHQHDDGTWWFYEATWNLEQGPYASEDDATAALTQYCIEYQKSLTKPEKSVTVKDDETPERPETP